MKNAARVNLMGISLVCLALAGTAGGIKAQDLSAFFKNADGAFVLYDVQQKTYVRYHEARCRRRFSPFSTFKIPNSLIGLETGVIRDADSVITWDRRKYPPQENWNSEPFAHWAQDHTLQSALKYSVVWYYRELAKMIGERRMKNFLTKFEYGNQDISGGLSSPRMFEGFWLGSTLQISADEQVEFLKKFYTESLPVSCRSTAIIKDILVVEETPAYKLSGKTGGGPAGNGKTLGWFVGYVETKDGVYIFATNLEGANFAAIRERRIDITKQILRALGHLPK